MRSLRGVARWGLAIAVAVGVSGGADLAAQASRPVVYDVDGVRVVHRYLPQGEVVAAHLYLLGGARQVTAETAGIEPLLLRASGRGTDRFPGEEVIAEQVSTGSRYFVSASADWSVIGFTGLADEFARSWTVLTERVMRPTLDSAAVALVRNQALTSIRAGGEDPDGRVRELAAEMAFAEHPYSVDVGGTEASLTALSIDDLRAYHTEHFVRSRLLLSVVGPITEEEVQAAVRATLTELPAGSYAWEAPSTWGKPAPDVVVEQRALPTNYIMGYFAGPTSTDEDYPAFLVAVNILSSFVSSQIREEGLSYAAGASFVDRAATGGGVFVSTIYPAETMKIINETIEVLGQGTFPRYLLRDFADNSTLGYYLSNQTSTQQADFIASSLLLRGRPQIAADWVEDLRGVAPNEVRRMFRDYVVNIQYAYLGSPGQVPRALMLEH